jgi:hypothetical protein
MNIAESNHIIALLGILTWTQTRRHFHLIRLKRLGFHAKHGANFRLSGMLVLVRAATIPTWEPSNTNTSTNKSTECSRTAENKCEAKFSKSQEYRALLGRIRMTTNIGGQDSGAACVRLVASSDTLCKSRR